jgi:hypothetical protein
VPLTTADSLPSWEGRYSRLKRTRQRIHVHLHVPLSLLYGAGARLVDIRLEDGSIFKSDGWKYIESTFEKGTVHFIGLASDGGVHSRLNQVNDAPCHDSQL